ncbi:MAG: hypothetical protein L0I47_10995 [Lactococcus lactis]|nr:hypothetical protein [Lactococcus lactis]
MQLASLFIAIFGLLILDNATTWPIKIIGIVCLLVGLCLDERVIKWLKK